MKVLIAMDEAPVSRRAARDASRLFAACGAEFLVVNVAGIDIPWMPGPGFGMVAPLPPDPRWLEPVNEEDEARVAELAEAAGVPDAEPIATIGDAVTSICRAADEHDVDIIVVGSHDKSALQRLFDPSVASGVVRATHRPVLVVSGTPIEA